MSVRFLCTECHKLLSVSTRKIGSQVKCPKCQATIVVPAAEEATAQVAVARAEHVARHEDRGQFVGFDDLSVEIPPPQRRAPHLADSDEEAAPVDEGYVMISRRALYFRSAVLVLVAIMAFMLGYMSGRLSRSAAPSTANAPAQSP